MDSTAAPSFYLRTLSGEDFYSADYYGTPRNTYKAKSSREPVILSFFATWCQPCRREIPTLHELQKSYPDIKIFLVDVAENEDLVRKHVKSEAIGLPVLMDRYAKVAEKFGVKGKESVAVLPTLIAIERSGKILIVKKGYAEGDEKKLESFCRVLSASN